MARTSIQLNPTILCELRRELGKTQEDVGTFLRNQCGKSIKRSKLDANNYQRSVTSGYEKIERTGKTSPKTAEALADLFKVSLEYLKGNNTEPVSGVERLTTHFRKQLDVGNNTKLNEAYSKFQPDDDHADQGLSDEIKLKIFAEEICKDIEKAQWGYNSADLPNLAMLTGMTESELLTPVYVRNYWWVIHSLSYEKVGAVVVDEPIYTIQKALNEYPQKLAGTQVTARLTQKHLTYRFEITTKNWPLPWWYEFTSCIPDKNNGIRWISATQRHQELLYFWFRETAFNHADVVYDFDGKRYPSNTKKLCFVVTTSTKSPDDYEYKEIEKRTFRPRFEDEEFEFYFDRFEKSGEAVSAMFNWLTNSLKPALHPYLKAYPEGYWTTNGTEIKLSQPLPRFREFSSELLVPVQILQINLMEEVSEGEFIAAPWKVTERNIFSGKINEWISEPLPESGYDADVPVFEYKEEQK